MSTMLVEFCRISMSDIHRLDKQQNIQMCVSGMMVFIRTLIKGAFTRYLMGYRFYSTFTLLETRFYPSLDGSEDQGQHPIEECGDD